MRRVTRRHAVSYRLRPTAVLCRCQTLFTWLLPDAVLQNNVSFCRLDIYNKRQFRSLSLSLSHTHTLNTDYYPPFCSHSRYENCVTVSKLYDTFTKTEAVLSERSGAVSGRSCVRSGCIGRYPSFTKAAYTYRLICDPPYWSGPGGVCKRWADVESKHS